MLDPTFAERKRHAKKLGSKREELLQKKQLHLIRLQAMNPDQILDPEKPYKTVARRIKTVERDIANLRKRLNPYL